MRWKLASVGLAIVVIAAAGVYAWGAGLFWPCETLGRVLGDRCDRVLSMEARSLNGLAALPDGRLVSIAREPGTDPDGPVALVEIDAASGRVTGEVALAGAVLSSDASVSRIAVDVAGERLALSVADQPTTIIDRAGRVEATIDRVLPAYVAFDAEGRLLVEMGRNSTGIPDVDRTEVFDLAEPETPPVRLAGSPPPAMFASGVQTVLSGDGSLYARGVPSGRSGTAGVQVGPVNDRDAPSLILATQLRPGCTYNLPPLAFSPDGSKLAAILSCSARWGTVGSALAVWNVATGDVLARIPTNHGFGDMLWQGEETLLVTRYDPDAPLAELFRVRVSQ